MEYVQNHRPGLVWGPLLPGAGPVLGPFTLSSTGPVLGQYWASIGPVLGQYWASTEGSTLPSIGPVLGQYWASLGQAFCWEALDLGRNHHFCKKPEWPGLHSLAPQGTNLGSTWHRHRLLPMPTLTHTTPSQVWEILTTHIWGLFFGQNQLLFCDYGVCPVYFIN